MFGEPSLTGPCGLGFDSPWVTGEVAEALLKESLWQVEIVSDVRGDFVTSHLRGAMVFWS